MINKQRVTQFLDELKQFMDSRAGEAREVLLEGGDAKYQLLSVVAAGTLAEVENRIATFKDSIADAQ